MAAEKRPYRHVAWVTRRETYETRTGRTLERAVAEAVLPSGRSLLVAWAPGRGGRTRVVREGLWDRYLREASMARRWPPPERT